MNFDGKALIAALQIIEVTQRELNLAETKCQEAESEACTARNELEDARRNADKAWEELSKLTRVTGRNR